MPSNGTVHQVQQNCPVSITQHNLSYHWEAEPSFKDKGEHKSQFSAHIFSCKQSFGKKTLITVLTLFFFPL